MTMGMKGISIRVENGKISGEAPAGLPDGEYVLALMEPDDETDEAAAAALEAALHRGLDDVRHGRTRAADEFAAELLGARVGHGPT